MRKINVRSPYYLEVGAGEVTPPPPPIAPQEFTFNCGAVHNIAEDVGIVTYDVNTPQTGTFRVDITGSDVPAKFTLKWNGAEVTTDYIGLDTYDQDLLDAGVPIGEIATGATSTKANTFVEIEKTTSTPELVQLVVEAPLINDEYSVKFNCPEPPPVVITQNTQINIWFDASGSMNDTLFPLQDMVAGNLKDCLVQFYNNDGAEYDKYVKVLAWGSGTYGKVYGNLNERTFNVASFEPDVPGATNVINIVFQDEANPVYMNDEDIFNESYITQSFKDDITTMRDKLTNYPSDYITPIIFQVKYYQTQNAMFDFLKAIENGGSLGSPYSDPNYNLKDLQGQFKFYYNVEDGISYSSNPNYYRDLIIQAINDLGFSITCP